MPTTETAVTSAVEPTATVVAPASADSDTLVVEDLIEEVSIDGMCGVY
ncbi:MAG TPA: mycofactocin precursor MftA [Nocardioides sp.]|nr:mycofactocin precursor MftA [uncultured Nocardioides sp.]HCB05501.1 mycofactocin precursor [Nocardioides sp.]HRD63983.1 mycofactocin precursor MftA [Nocardioides sp.]HRI95554.1 mycofactocin precursor MftA [Nocardioides sp.]HRK45911.1 mycofactocin precursor MftA [Nocardioides sp.]